MNKKGQAGIMAIFITLLIGLIAFTVANPLIINKIQTTAVTHDTFIASNTSCVSVASLCINSLTATVNASNGVAIGVGNWTICRSSLANDGLQLTGDAGVQALYDGENINASYVMQDCQPITGTTGTILSYVPLLFAVILLVFVATQIK